MTVLAAAAPSTYSDVAEGLALLVLLCELAMLRGSLLRSQARLYAFQSLVVAGFAAYVATVRQVPELYAVAGVSLVLKAIVVPTLLVRLLAGGRSELLAPGRVSVPTATFVAIGLAGFGAFIAGGIGFHPALVPVHAFSIALAAIFVSFVVVIVRPDVVSQAVGFFALENAVSIASIVVATGLPLLSELVFLFDLLIAVVVFAALARVHHSQARTLSTEAIDRLKG